MGGDVDAAEVEDASGGKDEDGDGCWWVEVEERGCSEDRISSRSCTDCFTEDTQTVLNRW